MDNMVNDLKIEIPIEDLKKERAGSSSTIYWGDRVGGGSNQATRPRLGIKWWSSGNSSNNTSTVTVEVWFNSSTINFSQTKYGNVIINGTNYGFSIPNMSLGSGSSPNYNITHLATATATITHDSNGSKSITVGANWTCKLTISGTYVDTMYAPNTTAVLDNLLRPPTTPTWCDHTGPYETDHYTDASWGGVSGTVEWYDVQCRYFRKRDEHYTDWNWLLPGNVGSWAQIYHRKVTWNAIQLRVKACNSAGESDWCYSGWLYHDGINANAGGGFSKGKIRVWDNGWKQAFVYGWDGSTWQVVN